MEKIRNYIGGEFKDAQSGRTLENFDPARGKAYSLVPDSNADDARAAIEAAQKAFPAWSRTPARERAQWLRKLGARIAEEAESLARLESIDSGKPYTLAKTVDIPRSQVNFEFFADAISQFHGETFSDHRALNFTHHAPLGTVVTISPWNLPLYLLTWKIAPALAAGNTVVAKPSEVTPMSAYRLSQLCEEIGFPKGVLNILHGRGAEVGTTLTQHPLVKAVSFTGSTVTGRAIAQSVAGTFKKFSLEMGGKNPNVVFADCDFNTAVETTVRSSFSNQGQICLCGSRIFVERPLYAKFRDALVEKTKALRVGDPLDAKTQHGALVSKVQMDKVLSYLALAKQEGGKILCGGERLDLGGELSEGYFIAPTLIEGLPSSSRVNQEEIFGPVATLIPFDSEEEVIAAANSTRYGLSASVWTQDITRANRVALALEAGVVWINTWMLRDLRTPFGGVKESGVGREGGMGALHFFTETKNICVEWEQR